MIWTIGIDHLKTWRSIRHILLWVDWSWKRLQMWEECECARSANHRCIPSIVERRFHIFSHYAVTYSAIWIAEKTNHLRANPPTIQLHYKYLSRCWKNSKDVQFLNQNIRYPLTLILHDDRISCLQPQSSFSKHCWICNDWSTLE